MTQTTMTAPALGTMTIDRMEIISSILTIDQLNATIEAQNAELARLRAELAATQVQLKRARNYSVAMSQPDAFKVGR